MRVRGWTVIEGWRDPWMCELIVDRRYRLDAWALRVYGDEAVAWLAWQAAGSRQRIVEVFVDGLPDIRGRAFISSVNAPPGLGLAGDTEVELVGLGALYDERGEVTGDTLRALVMSAQRMSP